MTFSKARNIFLTEITREGFFKRHLTIFTVAHYQTIFYSLMHRENEKERGLYHLNSRIIGSLITASGKNQKLDVEINVQHIKVNLK